MTAEKFLNSTFFKAVNILIAFLLLAVFFIAGQNTIETFKVARMSAMSNLVPQDMDYLWELNIHQAPLDRGKIHLVVDYYEQLLKVFPSLWEIDGILGYCYHELNDDPKAIQYLKIAVQNYPNYFWNYYNLAVIYIHESRYEEAADLLQKALTLDPAKSIKNMVSSTYGYWPLLEGHQQEISKASTNHLKDFYHLSGILEILLDRTIGNPQGQEKIKELHLELYAF